MTEQAGRKLAAILVSDVVGYSRLAGRDEELTLARLRALRSDLIDPIISVHHGRVVKRTGDGALVEFRSVVDAVRCAIETQTGLVERNAGLPPERRIEFRIGIHLGDVMEEADGDLMGDGVNIAARLETLCEPGGICLSDDAYRQVRNRLDLAVTDLGDQALKNIAEPMRVYALTVGKPAVARSAAGIAQTSPVAPAKAGAQGNRTSPTLGPRFRGDDEKRKTKRRLVPVLAIAAALIVIAAVAAWYFLAGPGNKVTVANAPAHLSIVVLPFANLSNDPKQDYFADGITENLTTDLSRIRNSFVIARNTAFTYKGKNVDAKEIGKELGVRYVLEGSVQRDGNRVRVNAQLIDAESGSHLWADRFEEDLADLFKLQDDVVARLANTLGYELVKAEAAKSAHSSNPDSIDFGMRGWALMWRPPGKETNASARAYFEKALAADLKNADAMVGIAYTDVRVIAYGWAPSIKEAAAEALDLLTKASAINPDHAFAYYAKSTLFFGLKRFPEAGEAARTAVALDQNLAPGHFAEGHSEWPMGQCDQALIHINEAFGLSPRDPGVGLWHIDRAAAELCLGRDAAAFQDANRAIDLGYRTWVAYAWLAVARMAQGDAPGAAEALAEAKRQIPNISVKWVGLAGPSPPRFVELLRKAGLPEDEPPPPPKHLSIVVLPFTNLSGDAKQDYFADGITENLTTDLSRIRNSFVIARNTAFTYKGKSVDAKEIGKELGVRYVLEGSVQRDGNRVRVNAQLIDAESGAHLWADRFEEDLADLFKLQDDVVARLANTLGYELVKAEAAKSAHSTNPDAIDLMMQGWALLNVAGRDKAQHLRAKDLFDQSLRIVPDSPEALTGLALINIRADVYGWFDLSERATDKAVDLATKAISINPNYSYAYAIKGFALVFSRRYPEGFDVARTAVATDPNSAYARFVMSLADQGVGRCQESIADVKEAFRLSPRDAGRGVWYHNIGQAEFCLHDYDATIANENLAINSGFRTNAAYLVMATAYAQKNDNVNTQAALADAKRLGAILTIKWLAPRGLWERGQLDVLRRIGIPEDDGPRLSIVVLPFQNLSGDAKQDYLADVLTDELTTYISRIPGSFVIARNTAFTYKGRPTDVKTIGKDLGVRYALEGSVQPTDKRIRTNAQLIDTETGAHLWAEQFDTDKTDLLETQDEIVTRLARTLQIQLTDIEAAKLDRAHPANPDAQDLAMQCAAKVQHIPAGKEADADLSACDRALALDPNNVLAMQSLAFKVWARVNYGQSVDRAADIREAERLIARALALDANNARIYWIESSVFSLEQRFDEADAAAARSIALDPSDINAYWNSCLIQYLLGKPEQVFSCIDKAIRLSPRDVRFPVLIAFKGNANFMLGRYEQSLEWYRQSLALNPNDPLNNIYFTAALSLAGHESDAHAMLERYLATASPKSPHTIAAVMARRISRHPLYLATYEHIGEGLRKAGMPEQ